LNAGVTPKTVSVKPKYVSPSQNETPRASYLTPRDLAVIAELTGTQATETKVKATNRISRMKGKFDAHDAIKGGMRWDSMRNKFVADADRPRGINATRAANALGRSYFMGESSAGKHNTGRRTTQLPPGHPHKRGRVNGDC
jgi:hypothetical protein